jgi:hypothetical protein
MRKENRLEIAPAGGGEMVPVKVTAAPYIGFDGAALSANVFVALFTTIV